MMLQLTPQSRVFLALEPADFRRGIDGLSALCRQRLVKTKRSTQSRPVGGTRCLPQHQLHGIARNQVDEQKYLAG